MFRKFFSKKKDDVVSSDSNSTQYKVLEKEDLDRFVSGVVDNIDRDELQHSMLIGFLIENVLDHLGYCPEHTPSVNYAIQDEIEKRILVGRAKRRYKIKNEEVYDDEDDIDEYYDNVKYLSEEDYKALCYSMGEEDIYDIDEPFKHANFEFRSAYDDEEEE